MFNYARIFRDEQVRGSENTKQTNKKEMIINSRENKEEIIITVYHMAQL